jgi:hypothetical protein
MFLQQDDDHDGRGTDRSRGRRGGRGNGGRGNSSGSNSKPSNLTSEAVNPYVCIPNEEVETDRETETDSEITKKSAAFDVLMNMRQSGSIIPRHWIILDSASSPDIFCERELVTDIRQSNETLKVLSRGGVNEIDQECVLPGYPGRVWFDSNGVANIIGLRNLIRHFNVTYDSNGDNCFHIWKDDKIIMTFRLWEGGLWYHDTSTQAVFSFLTTVKDNMKNYTPRGVKQAELARRLQDIVMRSPSRKLKHILAMGIIRN